MSTSYIRVATWRLEAIVVLVPAIVRVNFVVRNAGMGEGAVDSTVEDLA